MKDSISCHVPQLNEFTVNKPYEINSMAVCPMKLFFNTNSITDINFTGSYTYIL